MTTSRNRFLRISGALVGGVLCAISSSTCEPNEIEEMEQVPLKARRAFAASTLILDNMKRTKGGSKAVYSIGLIAWVFACLILPPLSSTASAGTTPGARERSDSEKVAAVKLNEFAAPHNGVAGVSFINLTGARFPTANGTISPRDVTISLSLTCGGSIVATTTASSVIPVRQGRHRIQFELPASLSTGQYFASISGMTSDGTPFSSRNCSRIIVAAAPSSGWTTLISRSWTQPAFSPLPFSEAYMCRSIQLLTDMYITGFRPISPPGTYFMVLTVSDFPFADAPVVPADFRCSAASGVEGEKAFYAAGIGTNDLFFPPGVAVHLRAGQFINMNLHVVNSTGMTLTQVSGVQVRTGSAADVTNEAEMFFAGAFDIGGVSGIPADGQIHTASGGCLAPQDYHVFALWPHMRAHGIRINLTTQHLGAVETLLDTPYTVNAQLVVPFAPPVLVSQGDALEVTCFFLNNNPDGSPITFGDSASEEQCFMGIYRYPVLPIAANTPFLGDVGTLLECVSF